MSEAGADLSYDFVNRPAYHHALVMADTAFLRLTLQLSAELGVAPVSLVHGLQNHDELTHELVHFATGPRRRRLPLPRQADQGRRSRRPDPQRPRHPPHR